MDRLLNETPEEREARLERMFYGPGRWYQYRIIRGMQDWRSPGALKLLGYIALAVAVAIILAAGHL